MESARAQGGRRIMEVRMESKQGTTLSGIEPALAEIQKRLQSHPQEWLKTLQQNPGGFANLEKEIHRAFEQMADRVVAGLVARRPSLPSSPTPLKKSNGRCSATQISRRRAPFDRCAVVGRLDDLCD